MLNIRWCGLLITSNILCGLLASGQKAVYDEPYRPQVHFSPRQNWTNDPNGLVYFHGDYHLFFQYNPFGDLWGHMSWGHAVSKDLLHWKELPVAIPEKNNVMIFTGSIVVDRENTSGFCQQGQDCLVAIYTGDSDTPQGHRQAQNIAFSVDRGLTWTQYAGNPVIDLQLADFRDPGVFWDDTTHHWVMAVSLPKEHKVRFYLSTDLKKWTQSGEFGPAGDLAGDWECPNLLRVSSDNGKESLWALKVGLNPGAPQGGSGEQYFLGDFDGKIFTESAETGAHGWTNYGKDDYCALSYNGLPAGEKPVLIGWMSNWQYAAKLPTTPWRGQMSLPRRLSFVKDRTGLALKQEPVTAPLRRKSFRLSKFPSNKPALDAGRTSVAIPYELDMNFGHPSRPIFGVRLFSDKNHWTEVGFDTNKDRFYVDRTHSGVMIDKDFPARTEAPLVSSRPYDLKLIVDRSSVEAYAQNGTIAMTDLIYPLSASSVIQIFPITADGPKLSAHGWELKTIWKDQVAQ
jgi:fructan beta-fructosidase